MNNLFNAYKIKSVLSLHAPVVSKVFFRSLLKKILNTKILLASMKTLTDTETCAESRHRILPRLTISVIGWFSLRDHLSLDRGKVMGSLRNNFQNYNRVAEQVLQ
jgi:hypothetical protein